MHENGPAREPAEPLPPAAPQSTMRESLDIMAVVLMGLFVLGFFGAIFLAKPLLLPIIAAFLLAAICRPAHHFLEKMRLPGVAAAFLLILVLFAAITTAIVHLAEPAAVWVETLPRQLREVEYKLHRFREPVERIREMAREVESMAESDSATRTPEVRVAQDRVGPLMGYLRQLGTYAGLTLILLFFMLGYGEAMYRRWQQAEIASPDLAQDIAHQVSSYLFTITIINICLGTAVGLAMFLLGMPNAMLWGVMAGLFNFVPYLGSFVGISVVFLVALLSFETMQAILVVPIVYFALTAVEGNFVTPLVLGRRFRVNPIVLFIWLMLWAWMWGVAGALIAVPLLMGFKIVCDQVSIFSKLGKIISL